MTAWEETLTAFSPLPPRKAIEMVEAAGIPHAKRLIRDQAAATLVRSYAMKIETIDHTGGVRCTRGQMIVPSLWDRIVAEGVEDDVWTGGTVHLAASEFIGGLSAVHITEIGFNEPDLLALISRQCGVRHKTEHVVKSAEPAIEETVFATDKSPSVRRQPDPYAIPDGALTVTIRQAGAALGFGRTKINELMGAKLLERIDIGGSVRITTASIRALLV